MQTGYIDTMASVLHITTGENSGSVGSRIPAIWFYGKEKRGTFHICSAVNRNENICFDKNGGKDFNLNKWISVKITQVLMGNVYQYQIFLNGKQVYSKRNFNPKIYEHLLVYIGDPWHPSQPGKIRNIIITGM